MRVIISLVARLKVIIAVAIGVSVAQSQTDQLQQIAQALFGPLPEVVDNPANPVTPAKVGVGRMLWHEPRLSLSGFISCNSWHNLATLGKYRRVSLGQRPKGRPNHREEA